MYEEAKTVEQEENKSEEDGDGGGGEEATPRSLAHYGRGERCLRYVP